MKKIVTSLLLSVSALSYAQVPSDFSLKMLEDSYVQSKTCNDLCGTFTGVNIKNINLNTREVVFSIPVSSTQLSVIKLPFNYNSLNWSGFSLDGKNYQAILTKDENVLVAVPKGSHVIEITAKIKPNQNKIEFSEDPKNFENTSSINAKLNKVGNNYFLEIDEGKSVSVGKEKEIEVDKVITGQPFYRIHRKLFLSDKWKLKTTITPIFANSKVTEVLVPLLEGENILNNNFTVENNSIKLSLSGNSLSWESIVQPKNKMSFKNTDLNNLERWTIYNENNWLYSYKGINPVETTGNEKYKNIDTWLMWPTEQINLDFTLPERVEGKTSNVTNLNFRTEAKDNKKQWIEFTIETSLGGRYNVKLEDKAIKLEELYINSAKIGTQLKDGVLALDLFAGQNNVKLKIEQENDFFYTVPKIKFESEVTNASFSIDSNRWVLLVGGGDVHSAILLWGYIVFFTLLAFVLSKIKESPLKLSTWLLLLLGLCETSYFTSVIIITWILSFAYRQKIIDRYTKNNDIPAKTFNQIQTALGVLTVVGLLTLFGVVGKGLLDKPELFLMNSYAFNNNYMNGINWYIQTWTGEDKMPWLFSLPLSYYKVIILAWAIWLAFNLMSWLKWMWIEYSKGGYWKKIEKKESVILDLSEELEHDDSDIKSEDLQD